MLDPQQLLGQILGGALGGSFGGRERRGKRHGGLLGGMSPATKAKLGIGLLGVAWAAYEHYSRQGAAATGSHATPRMPAPAAAVAGATPPPPPAPPPPPPASSASAPSAGAGLEKDLIVVIQAMIAAAAADGLIDDAERAAILARAREAGLDAETTDFLRRELDEPKSLAAIVRATRPEIAEDVYAASCLAITLDTEAERAWLDTLASRLAIAPDRREAIHRHLGLA